MRTWDQRRLVLPTTWFVEQPFQNWTKQTAEVLGTVEVWVDYRTPVEAVRAEFHRLVEASDRWDGRVAVLQVTDVNERALKVRGLVSSADAPTLWNLRCEIRENLVSWLGERHPSALPQLRVGGTGA